MSSNAVQNDVLMNLRVLSDSAEAVQITGPNCTAPVTPRFHTGMSSSHTSRVKRRLEDNMREDRIYPDARLPAAVSIVFRPSIQPLKCTYTMSLLCLQLEGKQHFVSYDRSSIHKPPQTPTRQSLPPPSSSRSSGSRNAQPPLMITTQQQSRRRTRDDFADLPPLQQLDEDDEDNEDERTLSRYQKESNSWLLFVCLSALRRCDVLLTPLSFRLACLL